MARFLGDKTSEAGSASPWQQTAVHVMIKVRVCTGVEARKKLTLWERGGAGKTSWKRWYLRYSLKDEKDREKDLAGRGDDAKKYEVTKLPCGGSMGCGFKN